MQVTTLRTKNIFVESGEEAPVSGYYIYKRNADLMTIPCEPLDKERAIILEKGQKAPYIKSCKNHAALYQIVATKSPEPTSRSNIKHTGTRHGIAKKFHNFTTWLR